MLVTARLGALAALFCLPYLPAAANASGWAFSGKARAGAEHQSNVNVKELEQASGQADTARLLEAELTASWQAKPAVRLRSGYSIRDKHYQQSDSFDSRLHLAYLDASYQLGQTVLGSHVYYARADLADVKLLTLSQASVYAMHSVDDSWFIRPALTVADKAFSQLAGRDASSVKLSTDSFWFFNAGKRFISVGLQYEQEHSRAVTFRYQAPGVSIRLSDNFILWQFNQQVQLAAKLSRRSYHHSAELATRNDTHSQLEARWQFELNNQFAILTALEYSDFSSTLDSANYHETRSSVSLQLSF
ncbi:surface lipoprotein assembly modifier [Rheinheimera oceanensis]|uniref:surface lipoprotein assembly modifier n=1 Tax=Rheinheimera oceanensis TaxID=2817449 RepID=UPI001BFD55B3|nr:surface lipoprotein assembly modifier [Rheinheimera oceanensis]